MCNDKGEGKMGSYAGGVGWGCGCVWAGGGEGDCYGAIWRTNGELQNAEGSG